jgi:hypothetical protein
MAKTQLQYHLHDFPAKSASNIQWGGKGLSPKSFDTKDLNT